MRMVTCASPRPPWESTVAFALNVSGPVFFDLDCAAPEPAADRMHKPAVVQNAIRRTIIARASVMATLYGVGGWFSYADPARSRPDRRLLAGGGARRGGGGAGRGWL